jgi:sulfite exporter TauE/SafE/copper chaperone CopZ
MAEKHVTARLDVDGMSCANCEDRIEKAVRALDGISDVAASASLCEVMVTFDPDRIGITAISDAVRGAGYQVRGDPSASVQGGAGPRSAAVAFAPVWNRLTAAVSNASSFSRFLGLIAVMAAIYLIIRYTVGLTFLPHVSQSMGYGLVFVVGLLTSLHCIAMCGGIVLSQGIAKKEGQAEPAPLSGPAVLAARLHPSLLYNGGRVVSYTLIGGIVGAFGSLFSISTALKGSMPVIAGLFMLFLGVRMLGIIPWLSRLKVRIPGIASEKLMAAASRRGPFVVGLLNGLMPCGPLQTMQVYALGTGSFLAGAFSMFLFSLGTVPLLLGFGAISSFLSAKFNRRMLKASGVLVMVLGFVMFTRGLTLFGVALPSVSYGGAVSVAKVSGSYQEVITTVQTGQYQPFVVQAGIPVRWTITVLAKDLNNCNNPIQIPQYGIRKQLLPGDNLVQFTPYKEGTFAYTCWMGMISSTFRVVRDLTKLTASELGAPSAGGSRSAPGSAGASCCGAAPAGFAGGKIPVDVIQIAKPTSEGQVADVTVNDNGYMPAVIVVQKGRKAMIRFVAETLNSCNSIVRFPEYQGSLDLSKGRLETPYLDVTADFTFECGMGMLHGYVKAVDDTSSVDLQAVKREVSAYKPSSGAGCCG